MRPFMFANLELTGIALRPLAFTIKPAHLFTDDDTFLEASSTASLGEIAIVIWECEFAAGKHVEIKSAFQEQKIHERSKKAAVHKVR